MGKSGAKEMKCPQVKIFYENKYKKMNIPVLSEEQITVINYWKRIGSRSRKG